MATSKMIDYGKINSIRCENRIIRMPLWLLAEPQINVVFNLQHNVSTYEWHNCKNIAQFSCATAKFWGNIFVQVFLKQKQHKPCSSTYCGQFKSIYQVFCAIRISRHTLPDYKINVENWLEQAFYKYLLFI